jgi:hypothetical protein
LRLPSQLDPEPKTLSCRKPSKVPGDAWLNFDRRSNHANARSGSPPSNDGAYRRVLGETSMIEKSSVVTVCTHLRDWR